MKADFLSRANTTKSICDTSNQYPRHYTHSDGVCRDAYEYGKVGTCVFLAPGRSDREYSTVALDSPARYDNHFLISAWLLFILIC